MGLSGQRALSTSVTQTESPEGRGHTALLMKAECRHSLHPCISMANDFDQVSDTFLQVFLRERVSFGAMF